MTRVLLVAAAVVAVLATVGAGAGAELHVNPGESIQDAINTSHPGDMIYVHAGTYAENVNVVKRLTLIGDGADLVTVRAADAEDHVFNVTADWVNVSGFAVAGAGYSKAGIRLSNGVDHCNIYNNNASSNGCGICLSDSSSNTLESNTASYNYNGIYLSSSSDNVLANNTVSSNNYDGIYLYSSSKYNTLANNTASSNNYDGIRLYGSSGNTLTDNTANSNNGNGIRLYGSSNNMLASNAANSNNTASSNNWGICLSDSSNNTLTINNLIDNEWHNAHDTGTNQWDSGSEGNYYSDYTGADNNTDGIGDDPHPIPGGGSIDRFPLMQPWTGGTSLKGDLNHDNQITPADAAITLHLAASGAQNPAADVSGDDRVTSLDALMILQAAAGRIEL